MKNNSEEVGWVSAQNGPEMAHCDEQLLRPFVSRVTALGQRLRAQADLGSKSISAVHWLCDLKLRNFSEP